MQRPSSSRNLKSKQMANKMRAQTAADDSDEESQLRVGKYTETSSVYQINKILSTDQYAVGSNIQQYLEAFELQYKSI